MALNVPDTGKTIEKTETIYESDTTPNLIGGKREGEPVTGMQLCLKKGKTKSLQRKRKGSKTFETITNRHRGGAFSHNSIDRGRIGTRKRNRKRSRNTFKRRSSDLMNFTRNCRSMGRHTNTATLGRVASSPKGGGEGEDRHNLGRGKRGNSGKEVGWTFGMSFRRHLNPREQRLLEQ